MEKLTDQDNNDIQYFGEEMRLDDWTGFDGKRAAMQREMPAVLKAWDDYVTAKKIFRIVIETVQYKET